MGQPKFPRKKYDTPNHPWQGDRIKEENEVAKKFGLKNKREIWKAQSRLRSIRGQARELISRTRNPDDKQAAQEAKLLLVRLHREGYVGQDATLGDVLGMDVERILNRRLQSQVYLKGMARTPKQARQFVSHGLVTIGERRVTVPSYVVRREEEDQLTFHPSAAVADPTHPVRPRAPGQDAVEAAAIKTEQPPEAPAEAPKEAAPETAKPEPKAEPTEAVAKAEAEAPAAPKTDAPKPPAKEPVPEGAKAEAKEVPEAEATENEGGES